MAMLTCIRLIFTYYYRQGLLKKIGLKLKLTVIRSPPIFSKREWILINKKFKAIILKNLLHLYFYLFSIYTTPFYRKSPILQNNIKIRTLVIRETSDLVQSPLLLFSWYVTQQKKLFMLNITGLLVYYNESTNRALTFISSIPH